MTEETELGVQIPLDNIPAPVVILEPEVLGKMQGLVKRARVLKVTSRETFDRGDGLNREIRGFLKEVEAQRKKVKAPFLDMGKRIDAAAKEAIRPLKEATDALSAQIVAFQREEELRRLESERKAAEERRKREEEERAREREAARKREAAEAAAREEERKAREAAEAGDRQAAEEARVAADEARLKAEKEAESQARASIKREAEQRAAESKRLAAIPPPAPVKSASVTVRKRKVFRCPDPLMLPRRLTSEGVTYPLWIPDMKLVEELVRRGIEIPGAFLEEVESVASKA